MFTFGVMKPKQRQDWIFDLLKQEPTLNYTQCYAKYSLIYAKSKKTFDNDWNNASAAFKEYQIKANKAKEAVSIQSEVEAVKKGLKTKNERLAILQTQIEKSINELEDDLTTDIYYFKGEPTEFERPLTVAEKSKLRQVIKELQSEISKIEGDYAAVKSEVNAKVEAIKVIRE